MLPRWFRPIGIILACLAFVPFAIVAKVRSTNSSETRPQIIFDMDQQPKFKTQAPNDLFADGRAMRPQVPGTVAKGELREDDHLFRGKVGDGWAAAFPTPVTGEMLARGRERYIIFCMPCHGYAGNGDGPVARRADKLAEGTWIPPITYHSDALRNQPVGQIFNTISNGVRTMPSYGGQIPVDDRWAIVAYVRALQRSRWAGLEDVPAEEREQLRQRLPADGK